MSHHTFLWHDYETFGADPRRHRPAQFAAVRTDADLNEIGEPMVWYCQPALDTLPEPEAVLITGITPQECAAKGLPEREFAQRIEAALAQPGTIGVGYNSLRFDDEFTRYMLWRNLSDPYAREWQNGCGRWDLLDVVRLAHALRPEGVQWPQRPDGHTSFKLEHLSAANGLAHEAAHDALSDVRATIALARLLRQAQPKLFEFAFSLHRKDRVMQELGLPTTAQTARPFLHVSGMLPPERGCLGVMWPLAQHPSHKNELIAWDLAHDPGELATLGAEAIRQRLFTRSADLPEGVARLPIKTVHLNRSPMVVSQLKTLRPERAAHWGIDLEQALRHAERARDLPDMSAIWAEVFQRPADRQTDATPTDVDAALYQGFVGDADRQRLARLKALPPAELALARPGFDDERLAELVFRFRARNHPDTLNADERQRWETHRAARLLDGEGGATTLEALFQRLDELAEAASERGDERAETLLGEIYEFAGAIAPER